MNKIEANLTLKIQINKFLNFHYNKIFFNKINIKKLDNKICKLYKAKNIKINKIFNKYQNQVDIIYNLLKEKNNDIRINNDKIYRNKYIEIKNNYYNKKITFFNKELLELNINIKEKTITNNLSKLNNKTILNKKIEELNFNLNNLDLEYKKTLEEEKEKQNVLKVKNDNLINLNLGNISKLKQRLKTIHNNLEIINIKQNIELIEEENLFLKNNFECQLNEIKKEYQIIKNKINLYLKTTKELIKKLKVNNLYNSVLLDIPIKIMVKKIFFLENKINIFISKVKKIIEPKLNENNLNLEIEKYKKMISKDINLLNYVSIYYEKTIIKNIFLLKNLEEKNEINENKLFESLLFNILNNNLNIKILVKKNKLL